MTGPIKRNKSTKGTSDFETFEDKDGAKTVYRKKAFEESAKNDDAYNKRNFNSDLGFVDKTRRGMKAASRAQVTLDAKKEKDLGLFSLSPTETYTLLSKSESERTEARKNPKGSPKGKAKSMKDAPFFKHKTKGK